MPYHDKLGDAATPREKLAALLDEHVADPERRRVGHRALAALRDPPSEPPGEAWTTPDPRAKRRHG